MKKQEESQPIDELFARKLGNASLSPSPDSFERLQVRMSKVQPEGRVVVWHNTTIQRYLAVAACLAFVCLFGWLYKQSNSAELITKQGQIATNRVSKPQISVTDKTGNLSNKGITDKEVDGQSVQVEDQLAAVDKSLNVSRKNNPSVNVFNPSGESTEKVIPTSENEQSVLAQVPQNKTTLTESTLSDVKMTTPVNTTTEQMADNRVKPTVPAERVLTVTIEEPASLIAAQQIAKKERTEIGVNEKPEKEARTGNIWQQVRRIKQGDVFARHDNPSNEDQGLLGRAYSGLKQSFEKDKSGKL